MATVLIVDDEPGVREGLVRAVASKGHRTVAAASLGEARAALEREELDCVLLDVRLRDGDGLDLLREMRAGLHRETPVIMATAYGDSERTIHAMKSGAFEYVTKPFDLPVLLDAVERAVRKRAISGRAVSEDAGGGPGRPGGRWWGRARRCWRCGRSSGARRRRTRPCWSSGRRVRARSSWRAPSTTTRRARRSPSSRSTWPR